MSEALPSDKPGDRSGTECAEPGAPTALVRYCLLAALLAMLPTLLAVGLQFALMALQGQEALSLGHRLELPGAFDTVGTLLLAPVMESALLAATVELARRAGLPRHLTTALSALCWALLHALLQGWIKFIPAAWGFMIFTHAYQVWRERSWRHASLAALLPHMLVNSAVLAVVFAEAIF